MHGPCVLGSVLSFFDCRDMFGLYCVTVMRRSGRSGKGNGVRAGDSDGGWFVCVHEDI